MASNGVGHISKFVLPLERTTQIVRRPYHFARAENLKVVNTADLVVLLYVTGRMTYPVAEATIGRLGLGKHLARTAWAVLGALARRKGE